MAIYHCHFQIVGRSTGGSATAASAYCSGSAVAGAAYRAGEKIYNQYDGITHDYTRKTGVIHSEIMLPDNAPREFSDRETLWNAVEQKNKRYDAQLARECDIALPIEFTREAQIEAVREYVAENFVNKGICADFAIHDKGDGNPHAHIMLTMNDVTENGFGRRRAEEQGAGYFQREKRLVAWRESWADICNARLKAAGSLERIDHRTLEAQGIDREPTIHVGRSREREAENREIVERNEAHTPTAVAQYMDELHEGHDILTKRICEMQSKTIDGEREILRINSGVKEIAERVEQVKMSGNPQVYQYFKEKFKIEPSEAPEEIERLKAKAEKIRQDVKNIDIKPYFENLKKIEIEYQKQKLLAEIRPDGQKILELTRHTNARLNRITDESFEQISRELRPNQVKILQEKRSRGQEYINDYIRVHERTKN